MSGATSCPACNRALPASVLNGPAQAVVRCEGCQTLLLWSNGRVMRSAKSSTPTMMGMPAVTAKPATPALRDAEAPLPELRPEGDAAPQAKKPSPPRTPPPRTGTQPISRVAPPRSSVTGLGDNVPTRVAPPAPELRKEATPAAAKGAPSSGPIKTATPPSGPIKTSPSGPIKTSAPPAPSAANKSAPSGPIKTSPSGPIKTAPSGPIKTAPSGPIKTAPSGPIKTAPSGPVKLPPAATPAPPAAAAPKTELPKSDSAKTEAPHVVAAVAQVPEMGTGAMVDPSVWFKGDVSDVVPPEKMPVIESGRPARRDTTGAAPLPPPPSLAPLEVEPLEIEAPGDGMTPAAGTRLPEAQDTSIATAMQREASPEIATPPATPTPTPTPPAPKKAASSIRGADPMVPAPSRPSEGSSRATILGRPALELPVKPAEPMAAAVTMPPATTPSPTPPPSAAPNTPTLMAEREISAESLPPPPKAISADEPTGESRLPAAQPETMRVPRDLPRRTLLIAGGGAVGALALVILIVALARGGKPAAKTTASPATATPSVAAPTPPVAAPTPPVAAPTPPEPAAHEPVVAPPPSEPTEEAAAPKPTRPRHMLGGKKVVLEYDPKPTSPAPPPAQAPVPMGEDPATVARAREVYHKGNVKLFAGDDKAAIDLYRESLRIYPGYVAGYRGLGLAFEEAGRKDDALIAFHTYVRTVPNAIDAAIIRRRIEHLEAQK